LLVGHTPLHTLLAWFTTLNIGKLCFFIIIFVLGILFLRIVLSFIIRRVFISSTLARPLL
jgi:hypothetical protein